METHLRYCILPTIRHLVTLSLSILLAVISNVASKIDGTAENHIAVKDWKIS
jgi:hypothetical protein